MDEHWEKVMRWARAASGQRLEKVRLAVPACVFLQTSGHSRGLGEEVWHPSSSFRVARPTPLASKRAGELSLSSETSFLQVLP